MLTEKQLIKYIIVLSAIAVTADFTYRGIVEHAYGQEVGDGLNEDQAVFCVKDTWTEDFTKQGNEKVACMLIDDLDLLNDTQQQYIENRFINEIDTFNLSDLTGIID